MAIVPGDAMLHPVALAAIGLLVANDHVLKALAPGLLTGKLSDVAGLAFFPLLLVGLWEVGLAVAGRWSRPSRQALVAAVAVTALAFVLVKTTGAGADLYGWTLGGLQWVPGAAIDALRGGPVDQISPAGIVRDPSDLVALAALAIPVAIGHDRWSRTA